VATRRTRRKTTVSEIRLYFEGDRTLEQGFSRFFSKLHEDALAARVELHIVAAKRGPDDFAKAIRANPHSWNILLKDSEEEMPRDRYALCDKHGIPRSQVGNVFWMVQLMESWFLADPEALDAYYGQKFSTNAIGQTADVERFRSARSITGLRPRRRTPQRGGTTR